MLHGHLEAAICRLHQVGLAASKSTTWTSRPSYHRPFISQLRVWGRRGVVPAVPGTPRSVPSGTMIPSPESGSNCTRGWNAERGTSWVMVVAGSKEEA
eukprot:scaffold33509_cov15-Tisochrysis_lutea.AAC.1